MTSLGRCVVNLGVCLIAHELFARLIPSPWWVPDVTLVGVVLMTGSARRDWIVLVAVAGLVSSLWAIRVSGLIVMEYLLLGGILQLVARYWDVTDLRMQCVVSGMASAAMTGSLLWVDRLHSIPLLALASVHVAMTCLVVPVVRSLFERGGQYSAPRVDH